jgi:hypothetical protein
MAVTVSTWAEFKAALASSETIIEVMADMDCNDDPPLASIDVYGVEKTVNGNGHTLFNLSTGGVVNAPIIWLHSPITFNALNFYNCYRLENDYFFRTHSSLRMYFNDCKIVGSAAKTLAANADYTRCSMSWTKARGVHINRECNYTYCWVHYDLTRTYGDGEWEFGGVFNSYLEGEWTNTFEGTGNRPGFGYWIDNSIINIKYPEAIVECNSTSQTAVSVYNITNIPNLAIQNPNNSKTATDAGMKDAAYLATLGFNIVT